MEWEIFLVTDPFDGAACCPCLTRLWKLTPSRAHSWTESRVPFLSQQCLCWCQASSPSPVKENWAPVLQSPAPLGMHFRKMNLTFATEFTV